MIPNLSKDMIDVMQVLRKALNIEFNLSLKLSQPDIVDQIQQWADKSDQADIKVACASLETLMGISPLHSAVEVDHAEPVNTKTSKRIYRGQIIEETTSEAQVVAAAPVKAKRMYRGQVVS
jgi:hypothetical protein